MHHHGSKYSSGRAFLDVLKPEVAICQAGDGNPYVHPAVEAIHRVLATTDKDNTNGTPLVILQNRGSYILDTPGVFVADPDGPGGSPGTITLITNGYSYTIQAPGLQGVTTLTTDRTATPEPSVTSAKYRLSLVENHMPVYHKKDYWVLIVYPEGSTTGTILCTKNTWPTATIFERLLEPGSTVNLWIAGVDEEAEPDIGQTLYTLTIPDPHLEPGQGLTFMVEFTISGDSGGPASMTFELERLGD
jgi:hypothetical protein